MSRIRIIKKNDEYSSEYEVGDIFEIQGHGTAASISRGNPAFRSLWIKESIRSWTQNPNRRQKRKS